MTVILESSFMEKKKICLGVAGVCRFFLLSPKDYPLPEKNQNTLTKYPLFFFPATNIYTAYLVTMLSSNMLKIRVHLLPAAELSYRKGGG